MGEAMKLTESQLHILQHTLGLDQYGRGKEYRNHFCAGVNDEKVCRELVEMGCMQQHQTTKLLPYFNCSVTDWGRMKMHEQSPEPPRLSKSKKRYLEYIEVADCFESFRHWLAYKQHRKLEHGESY
jgi:hypothetical protein